VGEQHSHCDTTASWVRWRSQRALVCAAMHSLDGNASPAF
jgi:hypothetical protein